MALADTLDRAAADVACGELGKARDRLQGLLRSYPSELIVRRRLAEVLWQLQYLERAGRYWYLFESESPEMETAKRAFEARFGGDPWLMLDDIRFLGGLDSIAGTHAEAVIRDLAKRAGITSARLEAATLRGNLGRTSAPLLEPWWVRFVPAALVLALGTVLVLALIGGIVAVEWLWKFIAT